MKPILLLLIAAAGANAQSLPWIDLSGPWRVIEGDDKRYSAADFDDSGWKTRPLPGPIFQDESRRLPDRFVWLRRTLDLPEGTGSSPLAITLGKLTENYQVFVNGQQIAQVGEFTLEASQMARPRTFDLPALLPGRTTIAVRLWIARLNSGSTALFRYPDPGPYVISGRTNAPREAGTAFINGLRALRTSDVIAGVALFSLGLILFLMYLNQRSRQEILWLALYAGFIAHRRLNVVLSISLDGTPWNSSWWERKATSPVLCYMFLLEFLMAIFPIPERKWLRITGWCCVLAYSFGDLPGISGFQIAFFFLLLWVSWRGLPRAVTPACTLAGVWAIFLSQMDTDAVTRDLFPLPVLTFGPYEGPLHPFLAACLLLAFVILITRRTLSDGAEKQRMAGELEAARVVQHLLLSEMPAQGPFITGAAYTPAREVGGDFYQVVQRPSGSLLVLTGDVSGKGLEAAMVASVVVGAFRHAQTDSPAQLLAELNDVLSGQGRNGFVTCCCARFDSDGDAVFANAGHPVPYLDGQEIVMEAGLPLGVVAGVIYAEAAARLVIGTQVTFVSDGVVEAATAEGELFGFDRTRDISSKSAQEIAEAAKAWGQNDDITVVTVQRKS